MKFTGCFYVAIKWASLFSLLILTFLLGLYLISPRAPAQIAVPDTKILELTQGTFRYQNRGTGSTAILFLHGFNSQLSIWNQAFTLINNCGRSIRLDIPGYGGSSWNTNSYSLADQAERIILFMDTLGLTRVTLVGVSMGASLAAWIAGQYPERVQGLLLMAPSGYPGSLHYGGLFRPLFKPGALNRFATSIARQNLYQKIFSHSTVLQALTVTSSYGNLWAQTLKQIRTPTWVLWSRADLGVPYLYAEIISRLISDSVLLSLSAQVGHDIPGSRPELISKIACGIQQEQSVQKIKHEIYRSLRVNGDLR